MNTPIIKSNGLTKTYRIWKDPGARLSAALFHRLAGFTGDESAVSEYLLNKASSSYREINALNNISFEINRGESVGIIGENGSGKSTLLQLLTGVLTPTSGDCYVNGKVAALLELGSGFNPQFTGRENVYLNSAILGFSRNEIDEKMDDILAFADIGTFVDEPVLTYSSGMVVRLAFSVQIFAEPEVLIIDEALAVGDMFFQAKCMNRMNQLIDDGTTVLFVSHALNSVKEICSRALLLNKGELVMDGIPAEVSQRYIALKRGAGHHEQMEAGSTEETLSGIRVKENNIDEPVVPKNIGEYGVDELLPENKTGPGLFEGVKEFEKLASIERIRNSQASVLNAQLIDSSGNLSPSYNFGDYVIYRLLVEIEEELPSLWVGFHIKTKNGVDIIHGDTSIAGASNYRFTKGLRYVVDWGMHLNLMHGDYFLSATLGISDPPDSAYAEWALADKINVAAMLSMAPRKKGMIDAPAVWPLGLRIHEI